MRRILTLALAVLLSGCITDDPTQDTLEDNTPSQTYNPNHWDPNWPEPPKINLTHLSTLPDQCRFPNQGGRISCPPHATPDTACQITHTQGYPAPTQRTLPKLNTKNWPHEREYYYGAFSTGPGQHAWATQPEGTKVAKDTAIHVAKGDTITFRFGVADTLSGYKIHRAWYTEFPENVTVHGEWNITPAMSNVTRFQGEVVYAVTFDEVGLFAWLPVQELRLWPKSGEDSGLLREVPMRACSLSAPVWVHEEPWYGHPDYTGPPPPPPIHTQWNNSWPQPPNINYTALREAILDCPDCRDHHRIHTCQVTNSPGRTPTNPAKPTSHTINWPSHIKGRPQLNGYEWVLEPAGTNVSIEDAQRAIHANVGDVMTFRVGVVLRQNPGALEVSHHVAVPLPENVTHVGGSRDVIPPVYVADDSANGTSFSVDGVDYLVVELLFAVRFDGGGLFAWLPHDDWGVVWPRDDGGTESEARRWDLDSCGTTPPIWVR